MYPICPLYPDKPRAFDQPRAFPWQGNSIGPGYCWQVPFFLEDTVVNHQDDSGGSEALVSTMESAMEGVLRGEVHLGPFLTYKPTGLCCQEGNQCPPMQDLDAVLWLGTVKAE